MDPYSVYQKQQENIKYIGEQRENYVDLTKEENPNSSVKLLANILFRKSIKNIDHDLSGILLDENMESADLFCMLVELVLYGVNILSDGKGTIFSLNESTDDIVYTIKLYLKSMGFGMELHEDFAENDQVGLYCNRDNYYCQIHNKPLHELIEMGLINKSNGQLNFDGWFVLNYCLTNNPKFIFNPTTPLEKFKTFFISENNKIFVINFNINKHL